MAADLRYTVTGAFAVAGARPGEAFRVESEDVDELGRHAIAGSGERILLSAALEAGLIAPATKATAAASAAFGFTAPAAAADPEAVTGE